MKTIKYNDCPTNFKGVEVTKWNEHNKWMHEVISSYEGKKDKWNRITRLLDKFPQYAEVTEIDFKHETVNYAHSMIKICADFLAGNVRNEDFFNEYVSTLNYQFSKQYSDKIESLPKSVNPD